MQFFKIAQIVIADRPAQPGHEWPSHLLAYFEGLFKEEQSDIVRKPHLSLQGDGASIVIRYEPTHDGLFILGYGGREDDQNIEALKPYRARGFVPMEALTGIQQLVHYKTKALQLDMSDTARLCLLAGPNSLIVGHTGLPESLLNLDSTVASFARAAVLLVTA